MQFRGWMLLAAVSVVFAAPAKAGVPFAIVMTKTVGVAAGCATTDEITVDAGTVVNYCYQVTNVGYSALDLHTLNDSVLGTLIGPNMMQLLSPGETRTEIFASSPINVSVTNTAVWTAMSSSIITYTVGKAADGPAMAAMAQDSATVNVLEMGDDACTDGLDNDQNGITDCADEGCNGTAVCLAKAPVVGTTGLLIVGVLLLIIGNLALFARRRHV